MRKQIAILSILFLISPVLSIQIEQIDSYNAKEDIRGLQIDQKTLFLTTKNFLRKYSENSSWSVDPSGYLSGDFDLNDDHVAIGSRLYGRSIELRERKSGKLAVKKGLGNYVDRVSLYQINNTSVIAGGTLNKLSLYNETGSQIAEFNGGGYSWHPNSKAKDLVKGKQKEILVGAGGKPFNRNKAKFNLVSTDNKVHWSSDDKYNLVTAFSTEKGIIVSGKKSVSYYWLNGSKKWDKPTEKIVSEPINLPKKFIYSTSDKLIIRNRSTGSLVKQKQLDSEIKELNNFPERKLLAGRQKENLSFFQPDGQKVHSEKFKSFSRGPVFGSFNDKKGYELGIATGKTARILKLNTKPKNLDQKLNQTAFVGNGRQMLKAVALNQTSFVTDSYSKVEDAVNKTGLKPLRVGSGAEVEDVNQAFNISRPKYYAGTREKSVYVSAIASRNNATLTFKQSEADRDFSNYSIGQLQEKFVEKFEPNHIVVADLGSEKGLLAAYMAVRQGSLPVDFDQEYSYPDKDVNAIRWDQDNGVISLNRKIKQKFEMIGENQKTVFNGKYVSLLSGPRKMHNDPVEPGIISDPEDGSNYYSDLSYGNLDSDRMLEAGVGRYPEDVSKASLVFHHSMEREIGENALTASEYLHSNWPVILATFGGGMRHGKITSQVLEKEGFNTTELVERRSQPVAFLFDLVGVPTQMDIFVNTVDSSQQQISSYLISGSGRAIKNAAYIIRGLQYSEKAMEMYFEFKWSEWDPVNQELDIPSEINRDEFEGLILSFLPEWKTNLNEQNLIKNMENSDIIYYQGIGNDKRWVLPNNDSSKLISDRYNGTNTLEPEDIPELDKPIVFDSSNMAGTRDAEMKKAFFEKGASAFIGFSGVNYAAFSSHIDQVFFGRGKTLGNSLKSSVNSLRKGSAVFHPSSAHITGVGEKMSKSVSLYGNPEMSKDPISSDKWNTTRECTGFECNVEIELNPEYSIEKEGGKKLLNFNTTDYLLVPGAPITPLYSANYNLPQNSDIQETELETDYKRMDNVYLPKTELLSHSGNYTNVSDRFDTFPVNLSNTTVKENELRHVQSGIQKTPNTTRVLQSIRLEFSYTTPVSMDVRKQDNLAVASVNSRKEFEAELIYRLDGNKTSKNVEINEGVNRFELGELEKGVTDVEAYLVDDEVIEQIQTELKLKSDPRIRLFAPDIHKGDVRQVRAVVENTNSFPVTEKLEVKPNEKLQLGMLENPVREVNLEPGSKKQVSWRFTGVRKGNSSVKLRNSSDRLTVKPGRSTDRFIGTGRFYRKLDSPYREVTQTRTDSKLALELETERGKLRYVETPDYEYTELETDSFRAVSNQTTARKIQKLSTSKGFYLSKVSNGVVKTESEGIEKLEVERALDKLNKESKKLRELYILDEENRIY